MRSEAAAEAADMTVAAPLADATSTIGAIDGDALCCVCLEVIDYNGSVLVECATCALRVHVRCYGMTVPTDGSPWRCEACQYVIGALPASSPADALVPRMQPQCAVCPIEGGALRQTTQPGVWCHVLCVHWIPELSHSITGELNQPIEISRLDRSRESLRCLVCGQRGGCIQCISGRCARAFHVLCAIRAPSSLIFTGYNHANRQVYHCKTHLSDAAHADARYELVDASWRSLPRVQRFLAVHPPLENKCRICQAKTTAASDEAHEAQCLLAWLTRDTRQRRSEELKRRGLVPIAITYAPSSTRGKATTPSSSSAVPNGNSATKYKSARSAAGDGSAAATSKKRSIHAVAASDDDVVDAPHGASSRRTKNPNKMKRKMKGPLASSANATNESGPRDDNDDAAIASADLSDVLFATWPGQNAGALMDSTHLWRVVNSNFYSSKALMKRRMESLCKSACGAKLDEMGNFSRKLQKHDVSECIDTAVLERKDGETAALQLKAMLHRCDFMMRASRLRCLEDIYAQPQLVIRPLAVAQSGGVDDRQPATLASDASCGIRVQFQTLNEAAEAINCLFAMHVAPRNAQTQSLPPLPLMLQDNNAVWSSFRHDAASLTLAGADMEAHKVPLGDSNDLWLAMAIDESNERVQEVAEVVDADVAAVATAAEASESLLQTLLGSNSATTPTAAATMTTAPPVPTNALTAPTTALPVPTNALPVPTKAPTAPRTIPIAPITTPTIAPTTTPLTDECTPEISLLIDNLKEQMKVNRYRMRSLAKKLQVTDYREATFQRTANVTELYYREFAAWKRLCTSLVIGYRAMREPLVCDALATTTTDVKRHKDESADADADASPSSDNSNTENDAAAEPIDDGTCVVCFDGTSPETNPIVFCDKCDLAVHQNCYGIVHLPSNEFYCDRCTSEASGCDPYATVFCQLCSLRDGAFKRTADHKWVHVVCALWCPNVWIGNLQELGAIQVVATPLPPPRFVDTMAEVAAQLAGSGPGTKTAGAGASSSSATATLLPQTAPPLPPVDASDARSSSDITNNVLAQGSLCLHCKVACGRTIQCAHAGCQASFHPLCGWYEGLPMTIQLHNDNGFVYAGGGAGLRFEMFCTAHLPTHFTDAERLAQRRRRNKFRIDAFFKAQCTVERPPLPSVLVDTTAEPLDEVSYDWIDRAACGACFQFSSPIVRATDSSEDAPPDVDALHKRQFLMRCQYCSTFIHPECCASETGSPATIYQRNWICERCTLVGQAAKTPCVVCDKTSDYLMPCITPPSEKLATNASTSLSDKWIHVLCSKWLKTKAVRKNRILCSYTPTLVTDGAAVRCDLCARKGRNLAQCARCPKRFHALCAATKRLYIAKSVRLDWKFYCDVHTPRDAVYDTNHQAWLTGEILSHLQDLRRSLERGRMLLEMARQRDRQQKRLLNVFTLPFMEASIEVVFKKRPTPAMREAYLSLTGEALTDTPRRRSVQPSPVKLPPLPAPVAKSKTRKQPARRIVDSDDEGDEDGDKDANASVPSPPRRRSTRGAPIAETLAQLESPAPRLRKRHATAAPDAPAAVQSPTPTNGRAKRRRTLDIELEPESPPSEVSSVENNDTGGRRRLSTRRKLETTDNVQAPSTTTALTSWLTGTARAGRGGMSPMELKRRFVRCLESATVASDFDTVVALTFPEMMDE